MHTTMYYMSTYVPITVSEQLQYVVRILPRAWERDEFYGVNVSMPAYHKTKPIIPKYDIIVMIT